jgi:hypothetical protein
MSTIPHVMQVKYPKEVMVYVVVAAAVMEVVVNVAFLTASAIDPLIWKVGQLQVSI